VTQRSQELAVRLALGASPRNILWLVLRQGLNMALIGALIGLAGAVATRQLTSGLLFGISAADPLTLVAGGVFLVAIAAIASTIPAARAMHIPFVEALRQE
jgi:putative ABC transport system permease protein